MFADFTFKKAAAHFMGCDLELTSIPGAYAPGFTLAPASQAQTELLIAPDLQARAELLLAPGPQVQAKLLLVPASQAQAVQANA